MAFHDCSSMGLDISDEEPLVLQRGRRLRKEATPHQASQSDRRDSGVQIQKEPVSTVASNTLSFNANSFGAQPETRFPFGIELPESLPVSQTLRASQTSRTGRPSTHCGAQEESPLFLSGRTSGSPPSFLAGETPSESGSEDRMTIAQGPKSSPRTSYGLRRNWLRDTIRGAIVLEKSMSQSDSDENVLDDILWELKKMNRTDRNQTRAMNRQTAAIETLSGQVEGIDGRFDELARAVRACKDSHVPLNTTDPQENDASGLFVSPSQANLAEETQPGMQTPAESPLTQTLPRKRPSTWQAGPSEKRRSSTNDHPRGSSGSRAPPLQSPSHERDWQSRSDPLPQTSPVTMPREMTDKGKGRRREAAGERTAGEEDDKQVVGDAEDQSNEEGEIVDVPGPDDRPAKTAAAQEAPRRPDMSRLIARNEQQSSIARRRPTRSNQPSFMRQPTRPEYPSLGKNKPAAAAAAGTTTSPAPTLIPPRITSSYSRGPPATPSQAAAAAAAAKRSSISSSRQGPQSPTFKKKGTAAQAPKDKQRSPKTSGRGPSRFVEDFD